MTHEVVMFPGLGAEYPGMVARFCEQFPDAVDLLSQWSEGLGLDLSAEPPTDDIRARQRQRQLQIHALNLLWWRRVADNHPQAMVCGHSLGFYAALVAAGVVDEDLSLRIVDAVFSLGWLSRPTNGHEVAIITSHRELDPRALLDHHRIETVCVNSDTQFAVYGAPNDIANLCAALGEDLVGSMRLDSSVPFHSWTMGGVSGVLQRTMRRDRWLFEDPKRTLWCHSRAHRLTDARAAAEALAAQARLPVLWRETILAMRAHRATRFVEVGPNRILSQIVRRIDPNLTVGWTDRLRSPRKAAA